jgi:hypothetical protein
MCLYWEGLGTDANRNAPLVASNNCWRNSLRLELNHLFCTNITDVSTHLFCVLTYAIHTNLDDGDSAD